MGIFEFIFGKSAPKEANPPKQAYYLNDDDAKSFGDIEYMRSNKTVRRTFAKKKGQKHMESVRQISAMKAAAFSDNRGSFGVTPQSSSSSTGTPVTPQAPASAPRRKATGKDMDMFRNMAKDIRK